MCTSKSAQRQSRSREALSLSHMIAVSPSHRTWSHHNHNRGAAESQFVELDRPSRIDTPKLQCCAPKASSWTAAPATIALIQNNLTASWLIVRPRLVPWHSRPLPTRHSRNSHVAGSRSYWAVVAPAAPRYTEYLAAIDPDVDPGLLPPALVMPPGPIPRVYEGVLYTLDPTLPALAVYCAGGVPGAAGGGGGPVLANAP
mmetsp:Transcript_22964/g.53619  ORF Transcript_22964/g.53619 Transcript_22964/m.53619 type:complete len:200 (+) Transcript_22964:96-695(+)